MSDWNLPPYRFEEPRPPEDEEAAPAAPKPEPRRPRSPRTWAGWENTFRADLQHLKALRLGWLFKTLAIAGVIGALLAGGAGYYIWNKYLRDVPPLPPREQLFVVTRAPGMKFYDRAGLLIASRGPRYGDRITLDQLPPHVAHAFLAAEDRRFYHHGAIDPYGIVRAVIVNARAGHAKQGASTITQQLAKGLFLTPDRTVKRKLQEMVMAERLAKLMTKDEILELYLNRIFFGANTYGVDGASRTYFGKPASQLTIAEAALLASLPKAPSRLALTRGMTAAVARSHLILANMRKEGWITAEQEAEAKANRPALSPDAVKDEGDFGYVLDYAASEALKLVGPGTPDLVVHLTLDTALQHAGTQLIREAISINGEKARASQGALLSLGLDGSIRALVGGANYDESPFNRAVQARRQPGSTFKVFTYATALEHGLMPTDIREDGPVKLGDWTPTNYSGGYKGPVTIETALINSINTVAVKVAAEVGGSTIGELTRRFGFTTIPPYPDLSIALGTYEVNLLELVGGFQVFQQGGKRVPPYLISGIETQDGRSLYVHTPPAPVQVYDVVRASMMVHMMKKVVEAGTAKRAAFGPPAAGKTGTSQNWRDAWFIGFTTDYVTGVWIGNDDDRPMNRVVGGDIPASIWRRFMIVAHKGLAVRDFAWLLPEVTAPTEPDPRNSFYETLASEFAKQAADAAPETDAPPAPDAPAPEQLPY